MSGGNRTVRGRDALQCIEGNARTDGTGLVQIDRLQPDVIVGDTEPRAATVAWVGWLALCLIALQLAVRGWVVAHGSFYWDDLILAGRSGRLPLPSSSFLLYDHDGHLMPGAFLTAGAVSRLAPMSWALPASVLLAWQAVASLAVLRVLRLLLGRRPILLVPLALTLFSPLTLPSFAWWSAALNALPLQAALAWVTADAILLVRTGRHRYALTGTVAFAVGLAFFEKAFLVPVVALGVVALLLRQDHEPRPLRTALSRGRWLWGAIAAVGTGWATVFALTVSSRAAWPEDLGLTAQLLERGVLRGLLPALLGGPWDWDRLGVSTPWADPPLILIATAWAVLLVLLAASLRSRPGAGLVWLGVGGYVAVDLALMVLGRGGPFTAPELAQTLRYVADAVVVVAIGAALVLRMPSRLAIGPARAVGRRVRWLAAGAASVVFLGGSLWSTATFTRMWSDNPTARYLATARASLAAEQTVPLLDQPVPEYILFGLASPNNLASQVFSVLPQRPAFTTATSPLRMLDDTGRLVDAEVAPARTTLPGPTPDCGYEVTGADATTVPVDGPLVAWEWTVQLNYLTGDDGTVRVAIGDGTPVTAPVVNGLHSVFVRLSGGGEALTVRADDPTLRICIVSATVGTVQPSAATVTGPAPDANAPS